MTLWAKIRTAWQEFNQELSESEEKRKLRNENEGLKQHNAALMEQVRVMTQLLNVQRASKDQDKTLKDLVNILKSKQNVGGYQDDQIRPMVHNYAGSDRPYWQSAVDEYKGYYLSSELEADRELRTICENVLPGVRPEQHEAAYAYIVDHVKNRCADGLEWEAWKFADFAGYSGNRIIFETKDGTVHETVIPADEARPKLVFYMAAAKDHVNAFLAGMQFLNQLEADRVYEACCEAILYGTITDDFITPEQRREMRQYIRDAIQLRSRMHPAWVPPLHPDDTAPGLNGLETGPIVFDEVDLLPMVNPGHVAIIPADAPVTIHGLQTGKSEQIHPAGPDTREFPCQSCEVGEYVEDGGAGPNGVQKYKCTTCGHKS